jgi:hypothetical protein
VAFTLFAGKIKHDLPVVLLGKSYWEKVIDFDFMVQMGTIAQKDKDGLWVFVRARRE